MNFPLFISMLKTNRTVILVCTLLLVFYILAVIGIFPSDMDLAKQMPENLARAFGVEEGIQDLGVFLGSGFYGISFVLFLLIYCVLVATRLIAHLVDNGSMAYLLSTPESRTRIAITQASVLVFGLLIIVLLTCIAGLLGVSVIIKDAELNVTRFMQMNLVGFLLFFIISGYSFLFSCLFNEEKRALAASGILSVVFFLINSLGRMSQEMEWLNRFTPFTAFQPAEIAKGTVNVLPVSIGLGITGVLLYGLAIYIFRRRNLSL